MNWNTSASTSLSLKDRELINHTKTQLERYEMGLHQNRTNRTPDFDPDYKSNVQNKITHTFSKNDKENGVLLVVTWDRDDDIITIHDAQNDKDETITVSDMYDNLVELVTASINPTYNHTISSKSFELTNHEPAILTYVLLKYRKELSDFNNRYLESSLAPGNFTVFSKGATYTQVKIYLKGVAAKATSSPSLTRNNSKSISLPNLGDVLFGDTSGGQGRRKNTPRLTKSKEKVSINGKERQVYLGPRGGKYIKVHNKTVLLSTLKSI